MSRQPHIDGHDTISDAPTLGFGAVTLIAGGAAYLAGGQTITGFGLGDTLQIDNFTASSSLYAAGTLVLNGTDGGTAAVLCFYPGTRIATPQDLRLDDPAHGAL